MRYYSEDTVRSIIKSIAHTALEQSSNFADAMLQNQPFIEIEEPHGDIKDTDDVMNRLALKPTYDATSTLLSIGSAIDESPTIIKASK